MTTKIIFSSHILLNLYQRFISSGDLTRCFGSANAALENYHIYSIKLLINISISVTDFLSLIDFYYTIFYRECGYDTCHHFNSSGGLCCGICDHSPTKVRASSYRIPYRVDANVVEKRATKVVVT